ncbi:ABC transporter ATP-binding protein/permease [Campylobacter concisus]|uniref:ABC transporter ATP-binding protein/permease n=1 Tax=Campylobacter concisus TaxID=199 RepID=UPI003D25D950
MRILRQFFEISSWFWLNKKAFKAWVVLALMIFASLGVTEIAVLMNEWEKRFYDALSTFSKGVILSLVGEFLLYTLFIVIFIVCGSYLKKFLIISWRESLSSKLENLWLENSSFYKASFTSTIFDNPDQRIAEDSFLFVERSVNLVKSFVYNVANLIAFVFILWQASKILKIELAGINLEISGFLVYIAIIYTLICSLVTHLIGKKLKPLNFEKQHLEANYRADLLILRENAEAAAFLNGEKREKTRFRDDFLKIVKNYKHIINTEFRLECFSASYLKITNLIPIFASLPLYLAGTMSFGDMMQARTAFYKVQDGLAWFMDYYKQIMEFAASVERIYTFVSMLSEIKKAHEFSQNDEAVICKNLTLNTPNDEILFKNLSFSLTPKKWLVLSAKSGAGKSTAFRYLANLWQYGKAEVSMPKDGVMFIPQKPYLVRSSLRELISYPNKNEQNDSEIYKILARVGLSKFKNLDEILDYPKIMSGGEAQRLNFARVYLAKPKFLFLDEATSALDNASAAEILKNLKSNFKELGVMMITHQRELFGLFDEVIDIKSE